MPIDERIKKFKANLNFFCNWEEMANKSWKEANFEDQKDSRLILYCGLKDEIEGLTLADCGRMVDVVNGPETWDYIFNIINAGRGGGPKNLEGTLQDGSKSGHSPESP